jgi:transposase InsO family protein
MKLTLLTILIALLSSLNLFSYIKHTVLDQNVVHYMQEARLKAENWRIYYNSERPHKALKYASPWDLIE